MWEPEDLLLGLVFPGVGVIHRIRLLPSLET